MAMVLNVLFEVTIYSVILYGAILLFKKVFHKHISAVLNYAVWGLLILRLLIPMTIDSGFSLFVIPDTSTPIVQAGKVNDNNLEDVQSQKDVSLTAQSTSDNATEETTGVKTIDPEVPNVSQPQNTGWKIEWQTVLVILWAIGVFGFFAYRSTLWLRLNRNIKRYEKKPTRDIEELLEACKNDLGIHSDIQVSVQNWINTPALSAALRPKVLLPENMIRTMDRRQIELGIRHELIHFRHKDHLISLLFTFLRCVYWFNPVVWLAFRQIEVDMEMACDARVTSRLARQERMYYINTMIDLSGDNPLYVLGMGLNHNRKAMEKRVRGMFMKKKTRPLIRITTAIVAGVILIICFTTACQPTPDHDIVIGKTGDKLESDRFNETVSAQQYEAPADWDASFSSTDGSLQVTVDASVEVPDATAFPTFSAGPKEITQEDADRLLQGAFGDTPVYRTRTDADLTKSEIEQIIVDMKAGNTDLAEFDREAYLESIQGELAQWEALYQTAPETYTPQIASGKFEHPEMPEMVVPEDATEMERERADAMNERNKKFQLIDVQAALGKDTPANLRIFKTSKWDSEAFFANMGFGKNDGGPGGLELAPYDNPTGLSLSVDQAKAQAMELASAIGLTGYQVVDVSILPSGSRSGVDENGSYDDLPKCYAVYLTKKLCNVPTTYVSNSRAGSPHAPRWEDDVLRVTIDDTGILHWRYAGVTDFGEEINSNVGLLSFNDIQERFGSQIVTNYSDIEEDIVKHEIIIDKAVLGMARIATGKDMESFMYVPVWDFFGHEITQYDGSRQDPNLDENNSIEETYFAHSYLTINAVDGSVIDRSVGY